MAGQRRTSGGLVAAAAGLGVIAPLVLAGAASAHVPDWTTSCDKISIKLSYYEAKHKNTVSLTLDGQKLLDKKQFGDSFSEDFPVPAHTKDLTAVYSVFTDQDPDGSHGWTVTKTATIKPCTPTHSPSPSPTTSHPTHSPTPTVTPSTSTPATPSPTPSGPVLASTGGGSDAPVVAAAGAGVIALGGGLLFMNRRRHTRRH